MEQAGARVLVSTLLSGVYNQVQTYHILGDDGHFWFFDSVPRALFLRGISEVHTVFKHAAASPADIHHGHQARRVRRHNHR